MHRMTKAIVALCSCVAVTSLAGEVRADDVTISEEARVHFSAGVALLQDPKAPRYEEAYREFKAAYAASPSFKILGNLGLCAMKIERDDEAIKAYEEYLKDAGPELGAQEREQIQRDLLTLKAGLIHVMVSSDPPGATLVDSRIPVQGEEVRNVYPAMTVPVSLGLRRGHHVLTAKLTGYVDQSWEFDAIDGAPSAHTFYMVKTPAAEPQYVRERPVPASAYVAGGITVALAIGGAVMGALALSEHDKYRTDNTGLNYGTAKSERSTGQTYNYVTDGLFAGAIVGAAVTTYLVLTRPSIQRSIAWPLPVELEPSFGKSAARLTATWVF